MRTRTLSAALFVAILTLAGGPTYGIPQPPHDEATHGITCDDCHVPYSGLNDPVESEGTATTTTTTTSLIDSGKTWTADQWVGGVVTISSGTSEGEFRRITSNTTNTLYWESALPSLLAVGDAYLLGKTTHEDIETKCKSCHNPLGMAAAMPNVGLHVVGEGIVIGCGKCHDPHNVYANSGQGFGLLRTDLRWGSANEPSVFPSGNPDNDFIGGAEPYDGVCESCHTQTAHHRNNASSDHEHEATQACTNCHPHQAGFAVSCDGCHDAPPATGAHLVHFGATASDANYGGTGSADTVSPDGSTYAFNCGNCHPIDSNHHLDGIYNSGGGRTQIDLSPVGAPAGSIKSMNAPDASYTPGTTVYTDARGFEYTLGTCSNVYCHSRVEYTVPEPVPAPGNEFPFEGYPISYPDFPVETTRVYETPAWDGAALACDSCHGFPPRTEYGTVDGGGGTSHSWIDEYNYENLHGWNMGFAPLACSACHNETVTDPGIRTRDATTAWSIYEDVPIAGFYTHVNGQADIAFDQDPVVLKGPMDLTTATYDPATSTCNNVACHLTQTSVQWGTPYRWWNGFECNACHRY